MFFNITTNGIKGHKYVGLSLQSKRETPQNFLSVTEEDNTRLELQPMSSKSTNDISVLLRTSLIDPEHTSDGSTKL